MNDRQFEAQHQHLMDAKQVFPGPDDWPEKALRDLEHKAARLAPVEAQLEELYETVGTIIADPLAEMGGV